ncbi:hypothetical protein ABFS82_03G118600 [Erythranthe guttata]|uniref:AB hydrolase-1 domain-containing protein n=1 Tax=Erythranthe guttata TaxID=4155 RepID=A0A022Q8A8_ERYGU|nr:PREDICTED: putative methylesterase 12, chloroplastic [Erythranthe guttata]XP_012854851.1 PREDICTED: putative methylesterase 12, chloroplastic [Erythranthe guttata]EYU22770.1 hypothetical protein MIMGU_mgv1a008866mg [Erythranthe guttata]|eukprot:XP_012854850.1 PREDICTED: putative methylesterase 12, chloroplastic [Erythranthe guttata]
MGNKFICMSKKDMKNGGIGSKSKRGGSISKRRSSMEEELLHRQALAMAIQQHQLSQRFDSNNNGSMSRRIGSTSSRRRGAAAATSSDPFSPSTNAKQLPEFLENIKTKKFVLVHGEGFGAWCWYKSIALLEESGLLPIALDLSGSGIDLTDIKDVNTLADYSKPLVDFLQKLPEDDKVILVGHSSGGACVSYALEHFPEKISKAVYLCATMVSDGQKPFDVFAEELGSAELFSPESKSLIYGNGKDNPPTGFMFEKQHMHGLYFNQSPSKDVALAMVSMRPIPLGPMMEKLSLSSEKYGTGRRFYIQSLDDHALSPDVQEKLVRENPPEGVFKIKGSDHCPFFSKPQSLHKILLDIAQIA